jgi:tRNA(His) 5'-end guanylyltransferase
VLRRQGHEATEANAALRNRSVADKNEVHFRSGINFNDLPAWQRRGCGVYWQLEEHPGVNPLTGEQIIARRRGLRRDVELPMKEDYSTFLRTLIPAGEHRKEDGDWRRP